MKRNTVVHAAALALEHRPVPPDQSGTGDPTTGAAVIGEFGGAGFGIWEMSPGVMTDVEADELFVVLSGAATIEFADDSPTLTLTAGDVVQLAAGSETVWTVTETLRKVYLTQ